MKAKEKTVHEIYEEENRLDELIEVARRKCRKNKPINRYTAYNYYLVARLLEDLREFRGKTVDTSKTYIFPGALWIAKRILYSKENPGKAVDWAMIKIMQVRHLATSLFRSLVKNYNLEFIIPSNVDIREVRVYLWADRVGLTEDLEPLYVLTMYVSFPFDISRVDLKSEYEPVSFLFKKVGRKFVLLKAFSRVHYTLYAYDTENLDRISVYFLRYGHTPKIVGAKCNVVSDGSLMKEFLDRLWLKLGDYLTRLLGIKVVKLSEQKKKLHVYVSYKLPKSLNNPFETNVHPYFIDIKYKVP